MLIDIPTIENTYEKIIEYGGKQYNCEITDTAGQDEMTLLTSRYAIGIHGYVLVYSVGLRQSFNMIPTIYDKILNYTGASEVPAIIVGQKSDVSDEVRRITVEEGQQMAKSINCPWIEVSAKKDDHIEDAFRLLLERTEGKIGNTEVQKSCAVQ